MQALSPRNLEILSLMGVEVWRQRVQNQSLPSSMANASWAIVEQPEALADVIAVCESGSPGDGLAVAEQKLLDAILWAAGWHRSDCLVILSVDSTTDDIGEVAALPEQAQCCAELTALVFGARAGERYRDALSMDGVPGPIVILPALSTMLTEPQSKRQCWNQLRKLLASSH